jgi:hypothetical protein
VNSWTGTVFESLAMRASRLMDAGQYLVTGALIGTAATLLAVNVGAMYDFLQFAKVRA